MLSDTSNSLSRMSASYVTWARKTKLLPADIVGVCSVFLAAKHCRIHSVLSFGQVYLPALTSHLISNICTLLVQPTTSPLLPVKMSHIRAIRDHKVLHRGILGGVLQIRVISHQGVAADAYTEAQLLLHGVGRGIQGPQWVKSAIKQAKGARAAGSM